MIDTPPRPSRILLVDPKPANATLLRWRFAAAPGDRFELIHVTTLREALALLQVGRFDAVILAMARVDSERIDSLRELRAAQAGLAVIVLCERMDEEDADALRSAGAHEVLGTDESLPHLFTRCVRYALERRQAQEQELQIERIVDASPDAVIVSAQDGVVRFVNDAAVALLQRPRQELVGEALGFSQDEGPPRTIEVRRGGGVRTAEMRVAHIEWQGQPATLASLRDVSESLSLAEQLRQAQKMEAFGQLAGGVAHDFNNLLTVIFSYTREVREQLDPEDPRYEDLTQVLQAGEQARALTSRLLTFSRKLPVQPQIVDLNVVVVRFARLLRRTLPEPIELVTLPAEAPMTAWIDPGQIDQVLMNLALNARDAMPGGGRITLAVRARTLPGPAGRLPAGEYVELSVSDDGCGIPPEHQGRVFEPFFSTKRVGEGTGLGLAVCYGIISQAGGEILLDSAPGAGATFTLRLPRAMEPRQPQAPEPQRSRALTGEETILVVEDSAPVRAAIESTLRHHGYKVHTAASGAEALRLLDRGEPVHLVLTDLVMPEMGGEELAARLRALRPELRVLFMSGYAEDAAPIASCLHKPFLPDELARRVRTLLDQTAA